MTVSVDDGFVMVTAKNLNPVGSAVNGDIARIDTSAVSSSLIAVVMLAAAESTVMVSPVELAGLERVMV